MATLLQLSWTGRRVGPSAYLRPHWAQQCSLVPTLVQFSRHSVVSAQQKVCQKMKESVQSSAVQIPAIISVLNPFCIWSSAKILLNSHARPLYIPCCCMKNAHLLSCFCTILYVCMYGMFQKGLNVMCWLSNFYWNRYSVRYSHNTCGFWPRCAHPPPPIAARGNKFAKPIKVFGRNDSQSQLRTPYYNTRICIYII